MGRLVRVQWTETARRALEKIPRKVRRGLIAKARFLGECENPRSAGKGLRGPLLGYYSLKYSRYRAVYTVEEEKLANGDVSVRVRVRFVLAGIWKEGDKGDIYNLAIRLLKLGALEVDDDKDESKG